MSNYDECSLGNLGQLGSGVLRGHLGIVLKACPKSVGKCYTTKVEILGFLRGLVQAKF